MSFFHSKGFKYFKNLIIGVGAAVVMIGALGKINSEPWGGPWITAGLVTEAILFAMLGILGPEKDYYWDKLYPGLDSHSAKLEPLTAGPVGSSAPGLNGEVVEQQLGGMLTELQTMSKSMSSLKALQEVDFSGTSDQIKSMSNFYSKMNEAMTNLSDSLEDTKAYKENLQNLNKSISDLNGTYSSLNNVYGNIISAMSNANKG